MSSFGNSAEGPGLPPDPSWLWEQRDRIASLIAEFRNQGYSTAQAARIVGETDPARCLTRIPLYHLAPLPAPTDPVAVLAHMFTFLHRVKTDLFVRLAGAYLLEQLVELRLVIVEGGAVRPTLLLLDHEGIVILADRFMARNELWHEMVMPPTYSTMSLSHAPWPPQRRVVDLGCGSGYLAVRAARGKAVVKAVDVTARAVGFTTLNAYLNKVDLDVRLEDFAVPLRDGVVGSLVLFNMPSLPVYNDDVVLFNHYGSAPNQLLETYLTLLAAGAGRNAVHVLWLCVQVPAAARDVLEYLRSVVPYGMAWQFNADVQSPFSLNEEAVARQRTPYHCWLIRRLSDSGRLFAYLQAHSIREVTTGVLMLQECPVR